MNSCCEIFRDSRDSNLDPARGLLDESQKWGSRLLAIAGQTPNFQLTWKELQSQIDDLQSSIPPEDDQAIHNEAASTLSGAFTARRAWGRRRKATVARKTGSWVQHWLTTFGQFLSNYSGIVEVMKGADQQFGGLAYGTLSIFLAVPIHKDTYERDIEEALDEFGLSFPRLQNLEKIYFDESPALKGLIVRIYVEMVHFAQECIDYYCKSSAGRVKAAMTRPPKTNIQVKIGQIRRLLAETRFETEVLMQKRIADIREDNRQLLLQIEDLCGAERERKGQEIERSLRRLESSLQIPSDDPHTDTAGYKALLDQAFHDFVNIHEKPYIMTWGRFSEDAMCSSWLNSATSQVLVVSGKTSDEVNHTTLSWLSYAPTLFANRVEQEGKPLITAYYYCQTKSTLPPRHRPLFKDVLKSWMYQIAEAAPDSFLGCMQNLETAFPHDSWRSDRVLESLDKLLGTFKDLLSELEECIPVTLLLDRVDQCRLHSDEDRRGEYSAMDTGFIIEWLVKLVLATPRRVRVLLTRRPPVGEPCFLSPTMKRATDQGVYRERNHWDQW